MSTIREIDASSVHRITSGQVVIDLPTAAKELLENSLDAHATSIEVRFKQYGLESIEVSDNGDGISEDDMEGIVLKHHTSKLQQFADLETVDTYGFRGEALNSLCAVCAKVRITTCTKESKPRATRLEYDSNGKIVSKTRVAGTVGTTVTLSKIFEGKLPVRRTDLVKNHKREFAKCVALIQAYGIVILGVKITVTNTLQNGRRNVLFSTNGNPTIDRNIINIFGARQFSELRPLSLSFEITRRRSLYSQVKEEQSDLIKVEGFISNPAPGSGRSSQDRQLVYINSRPCVYPGIAKCINECYKQFNPTQYPLFVANLLLDHKTVDVNVTPDKRTVLLHDEDQIMDGLRRTLLDLLSESMTMISSKTQSTLIDSIASSPPRSGASIAYAVKSEPSDTSSGFTLHTDSPEPDVFLKDEETGSRQGSVSLMDRFSSEGRSSEPRTPRLRDSAVSRKRKRGSSSTKSTETGLSGISLIQRFSATKTDYDDADADEELEDSLMSIDSNADKDDESDVALDNEMTDTLVTADTTHEKTFLAKIPDREGNTEEEEEKEEEEEEKVIVEMTKKDTGARLEVQTIVASDLRQVGEDKSTSEQIPSPVASYDYETERNEVSPESITDYKTSRGSVQSTHNICVELEVSLGAIISQSKLLRTAASVKSEKGQTLQVEVDEGEDHLQALNISKTDFARMSIIGQFNLGFIIARRVEVSGGEDDGDSDDLFIIDQHASDEKFNFERLQRETTIGRQPLAVPKPLSLTPLEELQVFSNLSVFSDNGFGLKIDEGSEPGRKCSLTAVPVIMSKTLGTEDFMELLHEVSEYPGTTVRCSKIRQAFAMKACRSSVMIGTGLEIDKMRKIVRDLGTLDKPWNCPHGRPTMRHLTRIGKWKGWDLDLS